MGNKNKGWITGLCLTLLFCLIAVGFWIFIGTMISDSASSMRTTSSFYPLDSHSTDAERMRQISSENRRQQYLMSMDVPEHFTLEERDAWSRMFHWIHHDARQGRFYSSSFRRDRMWTDNMVDHLEYLGFRVDQETNIVYWYDNGLGRSNEMDMVLSALDFDGDGIMCWDCNLHFNVDRSTDHTFCPSCGKRFENP